MALYEFGAFVLDAPERRLTRQGERVAVTGKTLDVLRLLVEAQGRLVDRQTFNAQLWPEVVVEDRNLTVHISALRKVLGSGCIETVAKSGYRLAVPVRALNGQASSESLQVQREARYQLSQAERVPALKAPTSRSAGYRAAMVEWIAMLDKLNQSFEVAIQAMTIGARDQALDALERCADERADNAPFIAEFPPFRPLRGEPRFERLLGRLGLTR